MQFTTTMVVLAAAFFQAGYVAAGDPVDSGWTVSSFVKCVQKTYPKYPGQVVHDSKVMLGCSPKKNGKRDDLEARVDFGSLNPAAMLAALKSNLVPAPDAVCETTTSGAFANLPSNFMIVTALRDAAQDFCTSPDTKGSLIKYGTMQIDKVFGTAVHKQADELHGGKKVGLNLVLTLTPGVSEAYAAYTEVQDLVNAACTKAFVELNTKGPGCTRDLNWYNAGKAHGETSTGAIDGAISLLSGGNDVMDIIVNYLDPSLLPQGS